MIEDELKNKIVSFCESVHERFGQTIRVDTSLSASKNNFNRHLTTFSTSEFVLTNFMLRFSGARAMFLGEIQSYDISLYHIISFEEGNGQFTFLEKYSENVYRQSILKCVTLFMWVKF